MKAELVWAHIYEVKASGALIYCPEKHEGTPKNHEYKGTAKVPEGEILTQCEFATEED